MQLQTLIKSYEPMDIRSYLNHCGIYDVEEFLHPTNKYCSDPMGLKNIRDAINLYKYHLADGEHIGILSDADVDGATSTALIFRYTWHCNPKVKLKIYIHEGKDRGLSDDKVYQDILRDKPNLLIIPDAGSGYTGREQILLDNGIDLLVLDHHNADRYIEQGVLINNQLEDNIDTNANLSGCGVTYKFAKAMDNELNIHYADRFIDLVGLSTISDSMPMNDYENRFFVQKLLDKDSLCNKFLKELIQQYCGDKELSVRDFAFRINPKINAVIRSDDQKMKQDMLKAMCEIKSTDYAGVAKLCGEYHKDQFEYVQSFIKENKDNISLGKNLAILLSDDVRRSCSGLIAGKVSSMFNHIPTIVCKVGKNGCAVGSFRGYGITRQDLQQIDGVDWCRGHDTNAFAVQLEANEEDNIIKKVDTFDIDFSPSITVLQEFESNDIPANLFGELDGLERIVGEGMPPVIFGIKNIKFCKDQITQLRNETIKISTDDYDIMIFKTNIDDFNIKDNGYIAINAVGLLTLNTFRGRTKRQLIVRKYELVNDMDCFE